MVTWYWIENSISQECNRIRSIAFFASAIVLYVLFHCTLCVFDKSYPSKCFSYESSVFWYYIKQIMNVYSCNGKNIFMRWKMECSIQLGCRLVEWNIPSFTSCRLVEWNIPSFTSWKYSYHCTHKHSLFVY
jgi:hypothetical protein